MAFTPYTTCDNKNLSTDQLLNLLLVADSEGLPALKTITANDALTTNILDVRNVKLSNTAHAIKATSGNLLGWNIINQNGSAVYVKFYNKEAASVEVGIDVPVLTLMVPANGSVYQQPDCSQHEFATAMSMAVTTLIVDTDATDPATAIHINVKYK